MFLLKSKGLSLGSWLADGHLAQQDFWEPHATETSEGLRFGFQGWMHAVWGHQRSTHQRLGPLPSVGGGAVTMMTTSHPSRVLS